MTTVQIIPILHSEILNTLRTTVAIFKYKNKTNLSFIAAIYVSVAKRASKESLAMLGIFRNCQEYSRQAINFFNRVNRTIDFLLRIDSGFNAHFVCYIFQFVCVPFACDVVGPLLLNASLLLVLTTDYSD